MDAYRNANELDPPPRFFFEPEMGWDYLSHLRWCWFLEADIEGFSPDERYITGAALIQRWSHRSYQEPRQLLLKLVTESRLMDIHPITGLTEGSEVEGVPPIEEGLFPLSLVEQIDADFGMDPEQHLAEIGTEAWRKKIAKAAAEARHNRKGGSRDKRKQIQEIWATGKYSTRDACAEAESVNLDWAYSSARKALRNTPDPKRS